MIGRFLNHYRILGKLGEGGMAEVYLAEDTRLDRKVALKVLPRETAADPTRLARFEREARVVAALNHPNIVTIYSVEEDDGLRFLTMELVDGQPLSDAIPGSGLQLDDFFAIALPLVEAVGAAHRRGVVHRDIKPANVMISSEGVVKLLDLGLARLDPGAAQSAGSAADTLTRAGRAIGTVPYMAPEQLTGQELDHRTDIFALGVVLYEMATGRRPFIGGSSAELISAILRDTPKQVTELDRRLPNTLNHTIRRCLEKRPEDRFQSATDVRIALEAAAAGRPGKPPPAARETVRVRPPPPRPAAVWWPLAAGLAAAVALTTWAVTGRDPARVVTVTGPAATAPALALALPRTLESPPAGSAGLSDELELALHAALSGVAALDVVTPPSMGDPATEPAAGRRPAYRLDSRIDWPAAARGSTSGGPSPRGVFSLVRLQDAAVIWSESFDLASPAGDPLVEQVAAVVRSRVGRLLGLEVPAAPDLPPGTAPAGAESEPPPRSRAAAGRPVRQPALAAPATPSPPETPAPAPGQSEGPPDTTRPAARAAARVTLALSSSLPSGVLTVYADTQRVYHRAFQFSEPEGGLLGSLGRRRKVGGELEDRLSVPPGAAELQVYVAIPRRPARRFSLPAAWREEGGDRLVIEIRGENDITVALD